MEPLAGKFLNLMMSLLTLVEDEIETGESCFLLYNKVNCLVICTCGCFDNRLCLLSVVAHYCLCV